MKKFLPKSANNPQGFTLIELLVVVAIIAILSVIGIAVFGGVQGKARDAKRKADIDAISKAYEANYNIENGVNTPYRVLTGADFQGGVIPQTPEKTDYTNLLSDDGPTYKVCATLEGGVAGCTDPSVSTCYCKSAAQADIASVGINQPCTTTLVNGTTTASCKAVATGLASGSKVYFCPPPNSNISCAGNTTPNVPVYTGNYYTEAAGGAPATIRVYKNASTVTVAGNVPVTVNIRTTNP